MTDGELDGDALVQQLEAETVLKPSADPFFQNQNNQKVQNQKHSFAHLSLEEESVA